MWGAKAGHMLGARAGEARRVRARARHVWGASARQMWYKGNTHVGQRHGTFGGKGGARVGQGMDSTRPLKKNVFVVLHVSYDFLHLYLFEM